jgi:hypothetical protein
VSLQREGSTGKSVGNWKSGGGGLAGEVWAVVLGAQGKNDSPAALILQRAAHACGMPATRNCTRRRSKILRVTGVGAKEDGVRYGSEVANVRPRPRGDEDAGTAFPGVPACTPHSGWDNTHTRVSVGAGPPAGMGPSSLLASQTRGVWQGVAGEQGNVHFILSHDEAGITAAVSSACTSASTSNYLSSHRGRWPYAGMDFSS